MIVLLNIASNPCDSVFYALLVSTTLGVYMCIQYSTSRRLIQAHWKIWESFFSKQSKSQIFYGAVIEKSMKNQIESGFDTIVIKVWFPLRSNGESLYCTYCTIKHEVFISMKFMIIDYFNRHSLRLQPRSPHFCKIVKLNLLRHRSLKGGSGSGWKK